MRAGRLTHLVRLEAPAAGSSNAHGDRAFGWESMGDAYAEVRPLAGRELEWARQVDARISHKVTLRYIPGLSTTWRLVMPARYEAQDRYFQVVSAINVDERDRELELMCTEVAL